MTEELTKEEVLFLKELCKTCLENIKVQQVREDMAAALSTGKGDDEMRKEWARQYYQHYLAKEKLKKLGF